MTAHWETRPGEAPLDLSGLKDKSIRTRGQLDYAEAANILKAFERYSPSRLRGKNAFSFDWLLGVHRHMFCDVWKWAGQIRLTNLNIGIPFGMIGQALGGLALDIAAWQTDETLLLEQSVTLHHRAVHIHPFENGNGRWARFVANLWLQKNDKPHIDWPESSLCETGSDFRSEYLKAIRLADTFDYSALTDLHRRYWPPADRQ